jgi:hypothetical protein
MLRYFPILLSGLMLAGLWAQDRAKPDSAVVDDYHARAREAIREIPFRVGDWQGTDLDTPEAAVQLLRPNALFTRRFVDARRGWTATLTIVQCRDTRDMAGHYPPVCYPAHGWRPSFATEHQTIRVGSMDVPVARYAFDRSSITNVRRVVVYGFFVLPGRGLAADMLVVRQAAADLRARGLGAAQVQVVIDVDLEPEEERLVFMELVAAASKALEVIRNGAPEESP